MSIYENRKLCTTTEALDHHVQFVGGAAAVTKVVDTGPGITVTYVGTGLVNLVWADNPGTLVGFQTNFAATVPAGLKGYTCVPGVPSLSAAGVLTLQLSITGDGAAAAPALVDLAALQWLYCTATFKRSGTGV